jgi:hypothetical protein
VIPAGAQIVDGTGDQLLACSRFSEDQDGCVCCRHVLDLLQYALQSGTLADDFVELVRGDEFLL